jgi:uncharacterized protein YggE
MKRLHRWAVVVWVAVVAWPVCANEVEPPHIAVDAKVETFIEPDYIEWVVDIRTLDIVPEMARKVNNTIYESLLDIADKAGIDEKEIISGAPAYEQLFREGETDTPDITRYRGTEVYRRVTLVMSDMDEFEEMLDAVQPLGVFYAVRRKSTKYAESIRQVELAALKDARQTAIE